MQKENDLSQSLFARLFEHTTLTTKQIDTTYLR